MYEDDLYFENTIALIEKHKRTIIKKPNSYPSLLGIRMAFYVFVSVIFKK